MRRPVRLMPVGAGVCPLVSEKLKVNVWEVVVRGPPMQRPSIAAPSWQADMVDPLRVVFCEERTR